jgi:hypothetical protein
MSDTGGSCTRIAPKYIWTQTKYSCDKNANNSQSNYDSATCDGAAPLNVYTQVSETNVTTTVTSTRPASIYNNPDPGAAAYTDNYATVSGSGSNRTTRRIRTWTYKYSDKELQERICKYNTTTNSIGSGFQSGPNADCGVELLPLTTTKSSISSKITAMGPDGGTGIHQGVIWGFHMLSKQAPLTEAKEYETVTSKVMIIMTDGENTTSAAGMNAGTAGNTISSWTGGDWYLPYGYPYSRRLDTAGVTGTTWTALQTEMNSRVTATCTNAKAAGIVIYTIGLATASTSNPTAVTTMLTNCATDAAHAYFPAAASDLTSVFQEIASQLADLRLAL